MRRLYEINCESISQNDFPETHALSSGLKSLAADGIEISRRTLGGHGFGECSAMIPLNSDYLSKATVEGDNYMITQQTARYLIKVMGSEKQVNCKSRCNRENVSGISLPAVNGSPRYLQRRPVNCPIVSASRLLRWSFE
ncbi:uncharacterized protein A1O5_11009 [Cladophialophora psammophila CBS 110553]|uniref:Acyl-CoA oxidase C-alpha1 domain-containing protein n=1 Tax=Cladophialophora psammophila CBS 110553 TaxID=1182543 RepID=W9WCS0_9EURO|nr:uncharacterized protein A1O5_11009 [Cladophialophora psammophila CBS 110553]EXJ65768.1 hypothetical protein A1O5_11009 [Cladophialophora psammophila CBS 110553]